MKFFEIFTSIRIQDLVDIFFLTLVTYYLYVWFRGTKAFKALIGLMALGVIFTIAQAWELFLTTWAFQILWQVLIILLIILFQPEIRQVLEKVSPFQRFGWRKGTDSSDWIQGFTKACFQMGKKRIGALFILERKDKVDEFLSGGIQIEGDPRPELLISIFNKESLIHDGAALIKYGRLVSVSNYLPIATSGELPTSYGTRHRAALGITKRSDAVVIIVSEERGEVSLACNGAIEKAETPESLIDTLYKMMDFNNKEAGSWKDKLWLFVIQRWKEKLTAFALVSIVWLVFAGQQDFESSFNVPVEFENLPKRLEITAPSNPIVALTVRGIRKDVARLSDKNVHVKLDLSSATLARNTFRITRWKIILPNDKIGIIKVDPMEIKYSFVMK